MGLVKPPHKSKALFVYRALRSEMTTFEVVDPKAMTALEYAQFISPAGPRRFVRHNENPFVGEITNQPLTKDQAFPKILKFVQELWTGGAPPSTVDRLANALAGKPSSPELSRGKARMLETGETWREATLYFAREQFFPKTCAVAQSFATALNEMYVCTEPPAEELSEEEKRERMALVDAAVEEILSETPTVPVPEAADNLPVE